MFLSKFSKIGNLFFFDEVFDVSISWNYILLIVTGNFGLGEWAKIERNDGKLLRWSIEKCTGVNSESLKQYSKIVWASVISSLEVARYDYLPHCFSQPFQPHQFSVKIEKKSNFQLVFEPVIFSKLFLFWLFHDCPLAGTMIHGVFISFCSVI